MVGQEDKIVTAGKGVLNGVNRKHVISMAKAHFEVDERDMYMDELSHAKEAFITGTTKKVMPVYQIDDIIIGNGLPGPITIKLQHQYEKYISEFLKKDGSDSK